MGYDPILSGDIQVGDPITQELMQKIKDNFDYLYGELSGAKGGVSGVPNGSFEVDSDSDGIPDSWTRSLYPGGSGAMESNIIRHGAKSYKFVHPGGSGNGGGYLESDYLEVSPDYTLKLNFSIYNSMTGVKNIVSARWFSSSKVYQSETQVYNATNLPSGTWKLFSEAITPASTIRYMKIRLTGGYNDTAVASSIYFDAVNCIGAVPKPFILFIPEVTTGSTSWIDVANYQLYVPPDTDGLYIYADLKSNSGSYYAYMRFRIGTQYSTEYYTNLMSYQSNMFTMDTSDLWGWQTVTMQMHTTSVGTAYGRSGYSGGGVII